MSKDASALRRFLRGFAHAARGIMLAFKSQRNMRVHGAVMVLVVISGLGFDITAREWCAVFLACGLVLGAEMLNTAIEWLADRVSKEQEESIRNVKDAAAGAVLVASFAAAAVGAVIFLPKLLAL